ncbi:MAG: hydrolase [Pseudomonadota bacterium]
MRKLSLSLIALLVLLACGLTAFILWASQRPSAHYLSDLRSEVLATPAPADASGNLLLIRPQLFATDYQSPAHLRLKLATALDRAQAAGLLRPGTLVALPEHIGTWLIGRGEKVEFYQARSRQEVRDWLLLGNPWLAVKVLVLNLDADRLDEALLRMKAEQMAEDYQTLFAGLAREYRITLLAGSMLLPEPRLEDGRLRSGDGPLRNLSLVFGPDGNLLAPLYSEPWPWQPGEAQQFTLDGRTWRVTRDWQPGYPQSTLHLPDGRSSAPLFLRGKLSWPVGGASRYIELTPHRAPQSSEAPGSHLLNVWLKPT